MSDKHQRAKTYRRRAVELRATADGMSGDEARRTLADLARNYDLLADRLDPPVEKRPRSRKRAD